MKFGIVSEIRIIDSIRVRKHYKRFSFLRDYFFSNRTRIFFQAIDKYYKEDYTGNIIQISDLRAYVEAKVNDPEDKKDKLSLLRKMRRLKKKDVSFVQDLVIGYSQTFLLKSKMIEALDEVDSSGFNLLELKHEIENIISISAKADTDYTSMLKTVSVVNEWENIPQTPIGIDILDELTRGGLKQGMLGVFAAHPHVGKTSALINVGAAASLFGFTPLHFTLEISGQQLNVRYLNRYTGLTYDELLDDKDGVLKRVKKQLIKAKSDLIVYDLSDQKAVVEDIDRHVDEYTSVHGKRVIVLIDYADLIHPSFAKKDKRDSLADIYRELRRIARHYEIVVWTATQANRKSEGSARFRMRDMAECYEKAAIADVIVGMTQTPEEMEDDMIRIHMPKNRVTGKKGSWIIEFDPDRCLMR